MKHEIELAKKYATLQIEIDFQLIEIMAKLKLHSEKQSGTISAGYITDIIHVKELLGKINDFLYS